MYLMDTEGQFVEFYTQARAAAAIVCAASYYAPAHTSAQCAT